MHTIQYELRLDSEYWIYSWQFAIDSGSPPSGLGVEPGWYISNPDVTDSVTMYVYNTCVSVESPDDDPETAEVEIIQGSRPDHALVVCQHNAIIGGRWVANIDLDGIPQPPEED